MSTVAVEIARVVNGVNVDDVMTKIGAFQDDATLGKSHFRVTNKWISGGHNQSRITGFYAGGEEHKHLQEFVVDADEPPVLAGRDIGANPAELLLAALASCLATTIVYHAAVRGIEIRSLEADLEGDIDLNGLFGLSDKVRRGYDSVRVRFRIDTDEENMAQIEELIQFSPALDTLRNGTTVGVSMTRM